MFFNSAIIDTSHFFRSERFEMLQNFVAVICHENHNKGNVIGIFLNTYFYKNLIETIFKIVIYVQ